MHRLVKESDFLSICKSQALNNIKSNRDYYKKYIDLIVNFVSDKKLLISNPYIVADLSDYPTNISDVVIKIYTSNALYYSNELANYLHEKTKEPTIRLLTRKVNEEFQIEAEAQALVNIFKLQKYKTEELNKIIKPHIIKGVGYLPPEIEIIDVYNKLYDISQFSLYEDNLILESKLYEKVLQRNKQITGRGPPPVNCKVLKKQFIEGLKISIITEWLLGRKNTILVGPWAFHWIKLGKDICANKEKIQIISTLGPEQLLIELKKYISDLAPYNVTYREQSLHIPKDFRTSRYTFYMTIPGDVKNSEKPFLDLFNNGDFEVIPYQNISDVQVGTVALICRFLFIDLWVLRFIHDMKLIGDDILTIKTDLYLDLIKWFRTVHKPSIYPIEFMGTHRDYSIDNKNLSASLPIYYPYFPHKYLAENSSYREIRTQNM
jgi:hypothetical protein